MALEVNTREKEGTYKLELEVVFPDMMGLPDNLKTGRIVIETAPLALMPHAVHVFLTAAMGWAANGGGAFSRHGCHVLQAKAVLQEYSSRERYLVDTKLTAASPKSSMDSTL